MSSDEEQQPDQDAPQRSSPQYQRSGYSSASRFTPGFGFDGPSDAWKKARGLNKPTYVGGSGTVNSEPQEVPVVEASTGNSEQDAIRRQRFLHMMENKPAPDMEQRRPQVHVPLPSAAEVEKRRRLGALRERGLEESKDLLKRVQVPVVQPPSERVLTAEQIKRQKHLTDWIDNQKPGEAEVYRVQFEGLKQLRRERSDPDVWIELDSGERIGAHKAVLACRSEVFRSMLCSHMQEEVLNTVHMGGFSAEAVESMIEYLYTGSLTTDTHHVLELLYLSSAYFLSGLKAALERRLSKLVSAPQVTLLLDAAEATESWQLYEELVNYCLTNKLEVQRAGMWSQLSADFKRELSLRMTLAA
jgi:hypothetical protein